MSQFVDSEGEVVGTAGIESVIRDPAPDGFGQFSFFAPSCVLPMTVTLEMWADVTAGLLSTVFASLPQKDGSALIGHVPFQYLPPSASILPQQLPTQVLCCTSCHLRWGTQ